VAGDECIAGSTDTATGVTGILRNRLLLLLLASQACACTAMLAGGGTAAGPAIGSDSRTAAQIRQDQALQDSVHRALAQDSLTRDTGLTASAKAGVVTLYGTVDSFAARDRAVSLARQVANAVRVDNRIRVDTR
jgi:osmotically-inducible protein OsmY